MAGRTRQADTELDATRPVQSRGPYHRTLHFVSQHRCALQAQQRHPDAADCQMPRVSWGCQRHEQAQLRLRDVSSVPSAPAGAFRLRGPQGARITMRCLHTLALMSFLTAAIPANAVEVDPNSGCPPQSGETLRQRPGEAPPERLAPAECDPTRLPTPSTSPLPGSIPVDRWRIIDSLGYPDNRLDPYATNNPLKGDRPVWGPDGFSVLTVSSNSLLESRHVPTSLNAVTGQLDGHQQFFDSETASIDAVLYEGDTIFRPPDYQLRLTPILNYSSTNTGTTKTTTTSIGAQAFFFEKHLRDVSAQYDFDSVRIGIQPITSDFRGFVLADQPLGVRFFGTRDNDIYQYSAGWFRRLPKNAARQNDLGAPIPANDLVMANLYVQDLGKAGLTSEFVFIYDRSRAPGTHVALNGATATFTTGARHDYDVIYLGY